MTQVPGVNPAAIPGLHGASGGDQRRQVLRQELDAVERELENLRSLLETLPEIFEGKFQERLAPMITQRQRLLEQNDQMRQQMLQLPMAEEPPVGGTPRLESGNRTGLRKVLHHAFGRRRHTA